MIKRYFFAQILRVGLVWEGQPACSEQSCENFSLFDCLTVLSNMFMIIFAPFSNLRLSLKLNSLTHECQIYSADVCFVRCKLKKGRLLNTKCEQSVKYPDILKITNTCVFVLKSECSKRFFCCQWPDDIPNGEKMENHFTHKEPTLHCRCVDES